MNRSAFPWIDQYLSIQLDTKIPSIKPGETRVVESPRRLRCQQSYGYVHAVFGIWLVDERVAISVPPGAGKAVSRVLEETTGSLPPFAQNFIERLEQAANAALADAGLLPIKNTFHEKMFGCNAARVRLWQEGDCRRLHDIDIPFAAGVWPPTQCFPDGIAYGVVEDGRIVSCAYAHRSGILEDRVADVGVETAGAYRRRGYAKTVVSAVTCHLTENGGEGLYNCSAGNMASIATARSAGYELYGNMLVLTTNPPTG